MGEGPDVSLEITYIVPMKNDLSRFSQAIRKLKQMNRIVKQNVLFSLIVFT